MCDDNVSPKGATHHTIRMYGYKYIEELKY